MPVLLLLFQAAMRNRIKSIDEWSPLLGKVSVGDSLRSINGNTIRDVLDYKYYAYDEHLDLVMERPDGGSYELHIEKAEGGELGLDFENYLMDSARSCANNCIFCFIDQLPPGMRKTLYFKDDDTRLSFLMGNYITLTNLSRREIERIKALRISPVNVSVHTTDPELRVRMLRNPRAGESIGVMREFAAAGIVMNCQIVCCPGINDGPALDRTMRDLAEMYPQVRSVSVVPVGLTKYREGLYPLVSFTADSAAGLIRQVEAFAESCLEKRGSRIFFCSDELYIKAGKELPPDEYYEEHVQLENGVGMIRLLETEFRSALTLADEPDGKPFSIVAGEAAAPYLAKLLGEAQSRFPTLQGRVYAVRNDFFGPEINVTGLITGGDMIRQLQGKPLGERLIISQNMLRHPEMDFLDDVTIRQAEQELGLRIVPVRQDGFELLDAMFGLVEEFPDPAEGEDTDYYRYNK